MFVLYIAIFLLPLLLLVLKSRKAKNFPPGPPRLPLIGSLPYLTDFAHQHSLIHINRKMSAQYGKIWGCYFGNTPVVKISDYDLAKEVFSSDDVTAR